MYISCVFPISSCLLLAGRGKVTPPEVSDTILITEKRIWSTMASLRNAVMRREHLERSQPKARKRLGLLEKHKDYVKRARNYSSKEKRIKSMKLKAALRNPDEFYFKMNNSAVNSVRGTH